MEKIGEIAVLGLIFGMLGTTFGGVIGAFLKVKSNKMLSFILEFAAGLMTAIICFDLIPQALEFAGLTGCVLGIIIGVIMMIFCDEMIKKIGFTKGNLKNNTLFKTGMIICIGLAVHNFPEGLAIGAGFEASARLGLSLAIAIAIHDVPEGISIALPIKNSGYGKFKAVLLTALSGVTTGIGAYFGAIVGNISRGLIGISLAFAAGAMLYIVSCELIPQSNQMYKGRFSSFGNILGIMLGILAKVIA